MAALMPSSSGCCTSAARSVVFWITARRLWNDTAFIRAPFVQSAWPGGREHNSFRSDLQKTYCSFVPKMYCSIVCSIVMVLIWLQKSRNLLKIVVPALCFEHGSVCSLSGFKPQPTRALAGGLVCKCLRLNWVSNWKNLSLSKAYLRFNVVHG